MQSRKLLAAQALQLERHHSKGASVHRSAGISHDLDANTPIVEILTFLGCEDVLQGSSLNSLLRACGKISGNIAGSAAT